jgi:hypothetical protein
MKPPNQMRTTIPRRLTPFDKANWTPRALEVFATAKALTSPDSITARHLLLALEAGDTVASKVFKRLGILPSAVLGCPAPTGLLPDGELYIEDFDDDFRRVFPGMAVTEAKDMGWQYLGTDCLLLLLARTGVSGVDLRYERVREAIIEV